MTNRVWIEPDFPKGMTDEQAEENCRLMNNLLDRLMKPEDAPCSQHFWWNKDKQLYCISQGHGTFLECQDKGHWFSLDYFGRDG